MYHWLSAAKGTVSLPYVKWGDTWYLAFLVAVPPAGPDDGATTLITGPDWTVTYNYATGLVTVTRGTSVLSASLTPDHCFHRIVWAHNDSTDVASLYLDNVSTPVAVDTTAGFATLTGGTVTIGTGVAYSVLIGDLRISQNVFDPVAAAGWGDPIGCCFDKCSTTVNPDDAAAGPVALHYEYNGVDNRTLPWPIRANPGSLSIRAWGGMGGRWQDVVAGQGGTGGAVSGTLNDSYGSTFTIRPGERGHHCIQNGYGGTPLGEDGKGGRASGGAAIGGDGGGSGGAGGGAGSELLLDGTTIALAGGGGGGTAKTILTPAYYAGSGGSAIGNGGNGQEASAGAFQGQGGFGATTSAPGNGGLGQASNPASPPAGSPGSGRAGGQGAGNPVGTGSSAGGGGGGYFGGGGGGGSGNEPGTGGGGSSWGDAGAFSSAIGSLLPSAGPVTYGNGLIGIYWTNPSVYLSGNPLVPSLYPRNAASISGLPSPSVVVDEFELVLNAASLTTAGSVRLSVTDVGFTGALAGTWYAPGGVTASTVSGINYARLVNWTGLLRVRFKFTTPTVLNDFMVVVKDPLSGTVTAVEWSISHACFPPPGGWSVGFIQW